MEVKELLGILARGEDGKHQFKANFSIVDSLASEMVAFSNSGGGQVFIGINDNGTPIGLTREDMGRLNQIVSNAASQSVRPPINPITYIRTCQVACQYVTGSRHVHPPTRVGAERSALLEN